MKDAFGGLVNLFFLSIFLIIIVGVLGFVFSYAKAFQMKNEVITLLEKYETANCLGIENCEKRLIASAEKLAYNNNYNNCPNTDKGRYDSAGGYYCYIIKENDPNYMTISVKTKVDIDLPVINRILGFSIFTVNGDTRRIYKSK